MDDIPGLIENDIRASTGALEDLWEKVKEDDINIFRYLVCVSPFHWERGNWKRLRTI